MRERGSEISTMAATMSRSSRPKVLIGSHDYIVYVVDDDARMCEALVELFASVDVPSVAFGSVAEYVDYAKPDLPACIILDVELPDTSGLDFQRQLRDAYHPPIVFITGHGNIPSSVRAIKDGAVDFLAKPFSQDDLMAAVEAAIARDRHERRREPSARLEQLRFASHRAKPGVAIDSQWPLNKQAAAEPHQRSHAPDSRSRSCRRWRRSRSPTLFGWPTVEDPARAPGRAMTWPDPPDSLWPSSMTTTGRPSRRRFVEAAGYDVRLYSSATMVWKHGGLSDIDCLISDIGMPDMDGFELRRLALSERPELPVIPITGRPEVRSQCPRASNVAL